MLRTSALIGIVFYRCYLNCAGYFFTLEPIPLKDVVLRGSNSTLSLDNFFFSDVVTIDLLDHYFVENVSFHGEGINRLGLHVVKVPPERCHFSVNKFVCRTQGRVLKFAVSSSTIRLAEIIGYRTYAGQIIGCYKPCEDHVKLPMKASAKSCGPDQFLVIQGRYGACRNLCEKALVNGSCRVCEGTSGCITDNIWVKTGNYTEEDDEYSYYRYEEPCLSKPGCNTCAPGIKGIECVVRDCSDARGGCGDYPCVELGPFSYCSCPKMELCARTGLCANGSVSCDNLESGYICTCGEGYTLRRDGVCRSMCEDDKICDAFDLTGCVPTRHSYECLCRWGYKKASFGKCEDVTYEDVCAGTICNQTNNIGCFKWGYGHVCDCLVGFHRDASHLCVDVDECQESDCDEETTVCLNTAGSYRCKCLDGMVSVARTSCRELGEVCRAGQPCKWFPNTICLGNSTSHQCICEEGFEEIDEECVDVDECESDPCHPKLMTCANAVGSYHCFCHMEARGLVQDENSCMDVDECSDPQLNECNSLFEACLNNLGSYRCICLAGFKLLNGVCRDVNECDSADVCSSNMFCRNTAGSYGCFCLPGYDLSSGFCIDFDECVKVPCDPKSSDCVNKDGGYDCLCKGGYERRDGACTKIAKFRYTKKGLLNHRWDVDDEEKASTTATFVLLAVMTVGCFLFVFVYKIGLGEKRAPVPRVVRLHPALSDQNVIEEDDHHFRIPSEHDF